MLVYLSGLDLSSSHLRFFTARLRERRRAIGSRWRRLNAGRQALLALAHLRHGHPYAQLAAGFGIGTTTAYRYITEAVEVLAALAPSLAEAVRAASSKAFVLLDGTLPTDRPDRRGPALLLRQAQEARAGGTVRVPIWGRWEKLSAGQQAVNRSHAKIRALVEPAIAALKTWRLLRKLRCSTTRITHLVQAALTLHLTTN